MNVMRCLIMCYIIVNNALAKPNFVIILTDDQDLVLNGMLPMNKTLHLIANEGITFQNAFVNSPVCCPSRSSLLTGKYLHNINVFNNSIDGNCSSIEWQRNAEQRTIAAFLNEKGGYSTFYAGKYLNQYGINAAGGIKHVPKGYDWWYGLKGNSEYFNYTLSVNGSEKRFTNEYLTDVIRNYAIDYLDHVKNLPFFMILSTPAPHAPFTPAPRHANAFPDVKAIRTPSFNHTPNNKHWFVQMSPKHLPTNISILDNMQRQRYQTLLAVDELVESVLHKLDAMNVLDETYVILTSDNGFHIGQFGQPSDKRQPYDTDVRIPFLIRGPGIERKQLNRSPITLIDLAPTILDLAEIDIVLLQFDGQSLKNVLLNNALIEKRSLLVEYYGEGAKSTIDSTCPWYYDDNLSKCLLKVWCKCADSRNNTYQCVRHITADSDFKFCQFIDDVEFREAYDLRNDPYELNNIAYIYNLSYYKNLLDNLVICAESTCHTISAAVSRGRNDATARNPPKEASLTIVIFLAMILVTQKMY